LSGSAVVGSGVLTAAAREEFTFVEMVIVKKSVAGSVGCPALSSALLKIISSSTCRILSETHE
jgi:hypothetical protein